MNLFEKRMRELEAEAAIAVEKPSVDYDAKARARRQQRKRIASSKVVIQTYRVFVTLECGHPWNFTLSKAAFEAGNWARRRFECRRCAEAALAEASHSKTDKR